MELSFVFTSVLRRWWLVAAFAVLGFAGGLAAAGTPTSSYESRALLSLAPNSSANVQDFFDPDRYIAGQITVLRSGELAELVAESLTSEETSNLEANNVRQMTSATQLASTNIVEITATANTPQVAQQVAQAYAVSYIASIRTRAEEFSAADIDELAAREQELLDEVRAASLEISDAVQTYIRQNTPDDGSGVALPPLAALAPEAEATRQIRMAELGGVLAASTELEAARVNSEIVSNANEPGAPVSEDSSLLLGFATVFGASIGIAVAVAWAATSRTVLDDQEAADIIGMPISGRVGVRAVADLGLGPALTDPPLRHRVDVERIAVLCETTGGDADPLVIAVAGTQAGIGVTSLCTALAERFADVGADVVLVDGDGLRPDLTRLSGVASPGITGLLDDPSIDPNAPFTTLTDQVSLLGVGAGAGVRLRATAVPTVVAAARAAGDVTIIDAGPLLASGSAALFLQLADVAVVAMPMRGQRVTRLREAFERAPGDPKKYVVTRLRLGRRAGLFRPSLPSSRERAEPIDEPMPTYDDPGPVPPRFDTESPAGARRSRWGRHVLEDDPAVSPDGEGAVATTSPDGKDSG